MRKKNHQWRGGVSPPNQERGDHAPTFASIMTFIFLTFFLSSNSFASEIVEQTQTKVIVREHPKTGRPYVSIVSAEAAIHDPFANLGKKYPRPDYRMLDPKIKAKDIPYEGPYSNRKKVYALAATLATVGTVGGVAGLAVAPAATGAGASGGAGAFAVGGGAVAAGTVTGAIKAQTNPGPEDHIERSESRSVEKS